MNKTAKTAADKIFRREASPKHGESCFLVLFLFLLLITYNFIYATDAYITYDTYSTYITYSTNTITTSTTYNTYITCSTDNMHIARTLH